MGWRILWAEVMTVTGAQAISQAITNIPENKLIFASKLYEEQFRHETSEGAYYQALGRMCRSGVLCRIGKGTYYRPLKGKYGVIPLPQREIVSAFTEAGTGAVVGYAMYNNLKLTTQVSKTVEVFSSKIEQQTKSIGNVSLQFCDLTYTEEVKNILCMLEILQNFEEIQDFNYRQFLRFCQEFFNQYNEKILEQVLAERRYKKKTLSFLKNILDYYRIPNNLSRYLSTLSKYQHPTMEAIYEIAQLS